MFLKIKIVGLGVLCALVTYFSFFLSFLFLEVIISKDTNMEHKRPDKYKYYWVERRCMLFVVGIWYLSNNAWQEMKVLKVKQYRIRKGLFGIE